MFSCPRSAAPAAGGRSRVAPRDRVFRRAPGRGARDGRGLAGYGVDGCWGGWDAGWPRKLPATGDRGRLPWARNEPRCDGSIVRRGGRIRGCGAARRSHRRAPGLWSGWDCDYRGIPPGGVVGRADGGGAAATSLTVRTVSRRVAGETLIGAGCLDALEGLTVLDLTSQIAGPYATKLLADMGARVIKVEKPGGDAARSLGPALHDQPGTERSATYQFLNTNKESVVLDLKNEAGREALYRIARLADMVVQSFSPAQEERLGTTYEALRARADVSVLSMTNFGHTGPYRDYKLSDTVVFAMGGEMFSHGLLDREPLKLGGTAALLQCGAMGAVAAMGAVHAKEVHGVSQHVDLALFDTQINSIDRRSAAILAYRFSGRLQERAAGPSAGVAGGIYPTADGYVEVTATSGSYWLRFVEMIDDDALRGPKWLDPAFAMSPAAKEEADAIVYPWMLTRTKLEVWAEARRAHAMVAPVLTAMDLANDPVFRERGLWTEVHHKILGTLPMFGRPYVFEKTPWRIRQAAPMLGEHTDGVLAEAGYPAAEISRMKSQGVAG
ncbi:MAG: hypothetical protein C0506_08655 [Anaerolinea sp.]|nr:hypothetical protein [Anaerolinea sp.]